MTLELNGFIDTEETIRQSEEADASYNAWGDELQADALALLATVRHLLSGREIAACEAAADIHNSDGVDASLLANLKTQFAREIARWKDGVRA
jgi:hypothetical protein